MRFTYDAYTLMLKNLTKAGFTFTDYQHYKECAKPCILRHDIDFDIGKACEFSSIEAEFCNKESIKVPSTFFVMLNTDLYNVFSSKNRVLLHRIRMNGCRIGLHFDEKAYGSTFLVDECIKQVQKEAAILSEIVEDEVTVVSMHRPSQDLLKANLEIPNMVNSYCQDFFLNFKYVSDSRMHWREDIDRIIEDERVSALHVLTHPIWYQENESNIRSIIMTFIQQGTVEREAVVRDNIRDLSSIINS